MVRIISVNVNGLENKIKRITDFIKEENGDLICLQEVHNIQETNKKNIRRQFKGIEYLNIQSARDGTGIIIRNDL